MNVYPNATNTIPGKVDFRIDLRDLSQQNLEFLKGQIEAQIRAIAAETGTEITMRQTLHILPTLAASHIMDVIEEVCQEMHLATPTYPVAPDTMPKKLGASLTWA